MTPSDNSFTISPHNLALLHSTRLHSYPVPLMHNGNGILNHWSFIVHALLPGTSKVFTFSVFLLSARVHIVLPVTRRYDDYLPKAVCSRLIREIYTGCQSKETYQDHLFRTTLTKTQCIKNYHLWTQRSYSRGVRRFCANKALEGQTILHKQSLAPPMLCLLRGFRRP